jgi:hypothetical protein
VIVREFVVQIGGERDFALIYGQDGIWCDLVRSCSSGYCGCELIASGVRRFEVRDYWTSHREFEAFREQRQDDIEKFRTWVAGKEIVEHEKVLGLFYLDDRGFDDEAGLVSR